MSALCWQRSPHCCMSVARTRLPGSRGFLPLRSCLHDPRVLQRQTSSARQTLKHTSGVSAGAKSRGVAVRASTAPNAQTRCESKLLLLELDSVVVDMHTDGHRVAFNKAFKDLGLECANWTPVIYNDLQRVGDGTAETMVARFFDVINWPLSVPTNERHVFVRKVIEGKQTALKRLLKRDSIPLRPGVESVIDGALEAGSQVALLAGTCSTPEEDVAGSVGRLLGSARTEKMKLLSVPNEQASTGEDGAAVSLEGALKSATAQMKSSQAQSFVQMVSAGSSSSMAEIGVDPSLLAASQASTGVSGAWMSAVAGTLGVPARCCVLLAANNRLLQAAGDAGMLAVAIPRKLNVAGTYPAAAAKFADMGPGGATWDRLSVMLDRR